MEENVSMCFFSEHSVEISLESSERSSSCSDYETKSPFCSLGLLILCTSQGKIWQNEARFYLDRCTVHQYTPRSQMSTQYRQSLLCADLAI